MTTEHRAWDGEDSVPQSDVTEQSSPKVLPGKGPGPVAGRTRRSCGRHPSLATRSVTARYRSCVQPGFSKVGPCPLAGMRTIISLTGK